MGEDEELVVVGVGGGLVEPDGPGEPEDLLLLLELGGRLEGVAPAAWATGRAVRLSRTVPRMVRCWASAPVATTASPASARAKRTSGRLTALSFVEEGCVRDPAGQVPRGYGTAVSLQDAAAPVAWGDRARVAVISRAPSPRPRPRALSRRNIRPPCPVTGTSTRRAERQRGMLES